MVRNLLYHVTPMANYRWNIYQLQKRLHLFDGGKMLVAVAQGPGMYPIKTVRRLFPPQVEVFTVDNDKNLRETASFPLLLARAKEWPKDEITFYAHTKGITHGKDPAVTLWTQALHFFNLDLIQQVEQMFQKKDLSMVGSLVRHGVFDHFPKESKWHYAGTFFWFKNEKIFNLPNWSYVPKMKYGTEAWPSLVAKLQKEAGVLYGPGITDLYNYPYLKQILGDHLIQQIKAKCS